MRSFLSLRCGPSIQEKRCYRFDAIYGLLQSDLLTRAVAETDSGAPKRAEGAACYCAGVVRLPDGDGALEPVPDGPDGGLGSSAPVLRNLAARAGFQLPVLANAPVSQRDGGRRAAISGGGNGVAARLSDDPPPRRSAPSRGGGGRHGSGWTVLAALATLITRVLLGPAVTYLLDRAYRHPSLIAQLASSLDKLTTGRLDLHMGLWARVGRGQRRPG